jgi:predicted nucleotidyltransferase
MWHAQMTIRDQVIGIIRSNQPMLSDLGVLHASVFGSVARGDDRPDSDVDVMIEVDSAKVRGILGLGRIQARLEKLVGRSVNLARRDRLRPHVSAEAERDAIHAF